jgi:branched-chain amino acid transport system substrate-binding protein
VYIIDDTEIFGKGVADTFEVAYKEFGGTVVKRDGAPRTTQDYVSLMTAAAALEPEAIYFGGVTASGGARIYQAAQQAGLADIPYVGPDGINDGDAATPDSFLNLAGDAAEEGVYSTLAGIGTFEGKEAFDAAYEAEYGIAATGYAAQGYTCAQILIDGLERAAATNPADMTALREALRVAITDTSVTYETVQGDIKFDENGDTSQLIVSIYSVEDGSWLFETQVDYATAQ